MGRLRLAAVVALFCCLGGWLIHRYICSKPVLDAAGQPVDMVLLSEIGSFAEPRFRSTLQAYLSDLDYYRQLPMIAIGPDEDPQTVASTVLAVIETARQDPRTSTACQPPPEAMSSLSQLTALLLLRCAGIPCVDYLRHVDRDAVLRLPENHDLLEFFANTYLQGRRPPSVDAGPNALRNYFAEMYKAGAEFRGGSNQVVAWSNSRRGFVVCIDAIPPEIKYPVLLAPRLDDEKVKHFIGGVSQSAFVFNQGPDDWQVRRARNRPVLWAQISLIVKTRGDDYYPIMFIAHFDPQRRHWWISHLSRQISPRMATTPHLVL